MEPSVYPVDLNDLADIWHTFMESGRISRRQESLIDPTVLQSWRRCTPRLNPHVPHRLSPARGHALQSVLRAQADLITIGTPVIEDIHQFIEGSECAILLSDGSACILGVGGDEKAIDTVNALGLGLGAYWSEGQVGTTAFGMVLVNAMPTLVVGAEHYNKEFHSISSSAAPIHDVRGRIIGLIGLVGPVEKVSSHTLALVMSAARAISNQMQADWSLEEANHRLLEVNTVMSSVTEGVIAWNANGDINHVNAKAGEMLNLSPASVLGLPINQLLELPKAI